MSLVASGLTFAMALLLEGKSVRLMADRVKDKAGYEDNAAAVPPKWL